jgi:translin
MPKQIFSKGLRRPLLDHFEKKDAAREKLNRLTRKIIRNSGEIIRNVHGSKEVSKLLKETGKMVKDVKAICKGYDELYHSGMVLNAFQEYAEACVFIAILNGKDVPTPKSLSVTESAYMLGLGDVIGELRREALLELRRHDVQKAYGHLDVMEELYGMIMEFNFPSGVLNIRHKQDVARSLIEKTRGELVIAEASWGAKGKR